MRHFRDRAGMLWDVVLGRESWGASVALFVPPSASGLGVRQTALAASAYDQAARDLHDMTDAALQDLLERSTLKPEGLQ